MRRTATRIGRTVALAVGLLLTGIGATVAIAQGAPSPLEQIVTALQQLQTSVDDVQQSVDALGASNNFLFTPAVAVESGLHVICYFVNVTNADRHVHIELIDAGTGEVRVEFADAGVGPGRSTGAGTAVLSGSAYCKFTVLDGTKADIRANLRLSETAVGTTFLSVTAE